MAPWKTRTHLPLPSTMPRPRRPGVRSGPGTGSESVGGYTRTQESLFPVLPVSLRPLKNTKFFILRCDLSFFMLHFVVGTARLSDLTGPLRSYHKYLKPL